MNLHRRTLTAATIATTMVIAMVAVLTFSAPSAVAQSTTGDITIEVVVVGDDAPEDLTFTLTPWTNGCVHDGPVTLPGAGGTTTIGAAENSATAVVGPITFSSADFTTTPTFSDVQTFDFSIGAGINNGSLRVGEAYTDPILNGVEYSVNGALTSTPSGFPAFNLVRDIGGGEFYQQGSQFSIEIEATADVSDGLQISELALFEFNAREVDTGRYHPPTLVLNQAGDGVIANSNNMGGVNPASMQVVDIEIGDEYVTNLSFDASAVTIAAPEPCEYRVNAQPVPGYSINRITGGSLLTGGLATFEFIQDAAVTCANDLVTIDMNTGASGIGTDGDDVVLGTPGNDVIDTGLGNDVICAGDGDDVVFAGPGDDRVFGELGNDKLFGGAGADQIRGANGDDVIHGNRGDDRLGGGEGEDRIFGYAGDDNIVGGGGNDKLHGNFGNDQMFGGLGDDLIFGYGDDDRLYGAQGNDIMRGNFGDDFMVGGQGHDLMIGSAGADDIDGQDGDDDVQGSSGDDVVKGGNGDDVLDGGIGTDSCDGAAGFDSATRCETELNIE